MIKATQKILGSLADNLNDLQIRLNVSKNLFSPMLSDSAGTVEISTGTRTLSGASTQAGLTTGQISDGPDGKPVTLGRPSAARSKRKIRAGATGARTRSRTKSRGRSSLAVVTSSDPWESKPVPLKIVRKLTATPSKRRRQAR